MQKTTYYWLGFGTAIAGISLSATLALPSRPEREPERGSGRRDLIVAMVAIAQETNDNGTQTKGDREPDKGGSRRD